ncbi:hypothetical protein GQ600_11962 [Phytophthora cactorum]|nr:hypothetical protein GQ600_11962 [Phytophthora cactorum]
MLRPRGGSSTSKLSLSGPPQSAQITMAYGGQSTKAQYLQIWVAYRATTAQLNLFHPGRPLDNSCLTLKACSGHKKPLQHIFWDYKCARDSWQLIIGLWMGCAIAEGSLTSFSIIAQRDERHQCQHGETRGLARTHRYLKGTGIEYALSGAAGSVSQSVTSSRMQPPGSVETPALSPGRLRAFQASCT